MTARRFGHGDKVYVVIEATAQYFDEQHDELTVQYRTELGTYETTIAVDSADVQVYPADEVTTEYGARVARIMTDHNMTVAFPDEATQREYLAVDAPQGVEITPVSRPVLPWTEVDR